MGKNFRDTLNERMKDPAFLAEWNAQEPERQIMRAIAEGREEKDMTQKQLAEITGITQAADAQASGRRYGHGSQGRVRPHSTISKRGRHLPVSFTLFP